MNKKASAMPFERIILLIIGLIAVIGLIFFIKKSFSQYLDFFANFFKQIFK